MCAGVRASPHEDRARVLTPSKRPHALHPPAPPPLRRAPGHRPRGFSPALSFVEWHINRIVEGVAFCVFFSLSIITLKFSHLIVCVSAYSLKKNFFFWTYDWRAINRTCFKHNSKSFVTGPYFGNVTKAKAVMSERQFPRAPVWTPPRPSSPETTPAQLSAPANEFTFSRISHSRHRTVFYCELYRDSFIVYLLCDRFKITLELVSVMQCLCTNLEGDLRFSHITPDYKSVF